MQGYHQDYQPFDVICREGDPSSDMFFLESGKLLICTTAGTEVKVIARIDPGEFIGELSFFDGKPRASHIVALEKCRIIVIPKPNFQRFLPEWFNQAGKNLTKKIRLLDQIIQESRFRKIGAEDQKPLTISEQRDIYAAITHQVS